MFRYSVFRFNYHIRKPRIVTQNHQTLLQYKKKLKQDRKNVHIAAKQYQDMIQNQYLEKHAEQMKIKYFNDQCEFRKIIAKQAFRLKNNIQAWQKEDEKKQAKINKQIHDEDLKKMNRQRIKKILTYESENYWYNGDNLEQKLTDQVIFPGYVASTEYYQRLHAEALVYENFDFKTLHTLRSNQDVIKQKNRLMIPIFNGIKQKIKQYKTDKIQYLHYDNQIAIDKINQIEGISEKEKLNLLEKQQRDFKDKLGELQKAISNPIERKKLIKQKLRILLGILGSWKEYTDILGMTSVQLLKELDDAKMQGNVSKIKKTVMNQIRSVKNTTFVDAVEEDTEEVEIALQDYLDQLTQTQTQYHLKRDC